MHGCRWLAHWQNPPIACKKPSPQIDHINNRFPKSKRLCYNTQKRYFNIIFHVCNPRWAIKIPVWLLCKHPTLLCVSGTNRAASTRVRLKKKKRERTSIWKQSIIKKKRRDKKTGICSIQRRPSEKQVFLITKQNCKCSPAKALLGPLQYLATGNSTKLGHTHWSSLHPLPCYNSNATL